MFLFFSSGSFISSSKTKLASLKVPRLKFKPPQRIFDLCVSIASRSLTTEALPQYLCTGIFRWCIAGRSLRGICRCSYQRCWYISWTWDTLLSLLHTHPHLQKKEDWEIEENAQINVYNALNKKCTQNKTTWFKKKLRLESIIESKLNITIHAGTHVLHPCLVFIYEQSSFYILLSEQKTTHTSLFHYLKTFSKCLCWSPLQACGH